MEKSRKILLLEPNYRNKYPPMGLMKLATYHRMLGDQVTFFKGNLQDFVLEQIYQECLCQLQKIEKIIQWTSYKSFIKNFIKKKDLTLFDDVHFLESPNKPLIREWLHHYRSHYISGKYKQEPRWDRVCVTTLFTFHWKITLETIEFAKHIVKNPEELKVGGIMATLMSEDIEKETGVKPIRGLLDQPKMLDGDSNEIIDHLPLDYSILDEIEYEYPAQNAFFAFMTKGCKRKCKFCAVRTLEPKYKSYVSIIKKFNETKKRYGEPQHLLLLDNNVLASPKFPKIVQDIKKIGFAKGAMYIEPNQLGIAIQNLQDGINDNAYIRRSYKCIHSILTRLQGKTAQEYYNTLDKFQLLSLETTTKENLLEAYPRIAKAYERNRNKTPKQRFVDFNQGTDCRYVTEEYMRLMSELAINPLRLAFDRLDYEPEYIQAIKLAAKYNITELSTYIFYNYDDSPEDLYYRLVKNIELSEEYNIHIYSFPMKYIPVTGEDAKHREYTAPKWNKKFIRAIQSILNAEKGIVPPPSKKRGRTYFDKAFGKNLDEFHELLYMPEVYIIYRKIFEKELGYTLIWQRLFRSLTQNEFEEAKPIIESNQFKDYEQKTLNPKLLKLLRHYTLTRDKIRKTKKDYTVIKMKYDEFLKGE